MLSIWEARVAQAVSAVCLPPLKQSLVCGISCERIPAVELSYALRVFSGYSGFPPSLKLTQNRTIEGHEFISFL